MMVKEFPLSILRIVFTFLMMVLLFICFSGCAALRPINYKDPFRSIYSAVPVKNIKSKNVLLSNDPFLTLSCHKMPLSVFCRVLSDKFNIGIVYSDQLSDKLITGEFKKSALSDVINVVSRQLSVDIVRVGNTFYIGSLRPEDRGVLVRTVLGYDSNSLSSMVSSMLSEKGKVYSVSSMVIVTDHESVLRRVSEMFDYVDKQDLDTWILQLCFIALRKDALAEAGFTMTPSGTLAYNISENRIELRDLQLQGIFNLGASSDFADLYASPVLLLRDGQAGTWKDGEHIPIPKKTVSDYGTVTVSGYEYVDTGFEVNATVTRSRRGGRLKLQLKLSDLKSYVEDAPVTSQSVCNIDADLVSGKIYLIGELSFYKVLDKTSDLLVFGTDRGKSVLQVWAQLHRVSSAGTKERPNYPDVVEVDPLSVRTAFAGATAPPKAVKNAKN